MNAPKSRACLLVLGMHRAGTSALTRVLNLLGATLPHHVLDADGNNEAGYWEPAQLVKLHDKMLAATGSQWNDWRSFDGGALHREEAAYYKSEIKRTILEEYDNASLFVIKDPRVCRFVPIYEEVLADLGIEVHFILQHRHPNAIVESLAKRDGITEGFASLIWLRHVLDAEAATRGKRRAIVWYEALLGDWRAAMLRAGKLLGIDWPNRIEDSAPEIESFLVRGLQHQGVSTELNKSTVANPWVDECYAALCRMSADQGENPKDLRSLSRIMSEFDDAAPIFGNAIYPELAAREKRVFATERRAAAEHASKDEATIDHLKRDVLTLKSTLSWRLTAPFREMLWLIRRLWTSRLSTKLRGAWRHPTNAQKRKLYRANYSRPVPAKPRHDHGRSRFWPNLRAILRQPFSRKLRKQYRQSSRNPR